MILQPYGTILAFSVTLGAYVSSVFARGRGRDPQLVWDALLWVLPFGLIGARAYHILSLWDFYRHHWGAIFSLRFGGLGIYGALVGGLVGVLLWGRGANGVKGTKVTSEVGGWLDIAAPGLAIAQSVGRFANYFNHELYGWPTSLPWGIFVPPVERFPGLKEFNYFHPLFLYESVLSLFNFVVLIYLQRRFAARLADGDLFFVYLTIYALGRFFLEPLRIAPWTLGGIRVAQAVSLLLIVLSVVFLVLRRVKLRNWQLDLFR